MNGRTIAGYKRVTKRTAFKLYKEGEEIYLSPVNILPSSMMWATAVKIKSSDCPRKWEDRVNEFEYYMCNDSILGRYAAFYTKVA